MYVCRVSGVYNKYIINYLYYSIYYKDKFFMFAYMFYATILD